MAGAIVVAVVIIICSFAVFFLATFFLGVWGVLSNQGFDVDKRMSLVAVIHGLALLVWLSIIVWINKKRQ